MQKRFCNIINGVLLSLFREGTAYVVLLGKVKAYFILDVTLALLSRFLFEERFTLTVYLLIFCLLLEIPCAYVLHVSSLIGERGTSLYVDFSYWLLQT